MSTPRFAVGDVVTLRSGGPAMTVAALQPSIEDPHPGAELDCVWLDGNTVHRARFGAGTVAPSTAVGVGAQRRGDGHSDPVCSCCSAPLLFSARQRDDGMCGPCSRGASSDAAPASTAAPPTADREFLIRVLSRTSHGDGTWSNRGTCAPDCLKCRAQRMLNALPLPSAGAAP